MATEMQLSFSYIVCIYKEQMRDKTRRTDVMVHTNNLDIMI